MSDISVDELQELLRCRPSVDQYPGFYDSKGKHHRQFTGYFVPRLGRQGVNHFEGVIHGHFEGWWDSAELAMKAAERFQKETLGYLKKHFPGQEWVGGALRYQRTQAGHVLRKFAEKIGITPTELSKIEKGEISPEPEILERIKQALEPRDDQ